MKECLDYLCRIMTMSKTPNTETKDQNIIEILDEINKNISQMTEINTLLKDRIIVLENEKTQSKEDNTLLKDRITTLEEDNTLLNDRTIVLKDVIILLDDEIAQYKVKYNVVENNMKMLNNVCLEPIIRNVAAQIMNHFFPLSTSPPLGPFAKASLKNVNSPILNIVMSQLNCYPTDIDALMNSRKDYHLNIIELKKKIDDLRTIIGNSPKFSDDLCIPLDIIANYESFVIHFGNLKM